MLGEGSTNQSLREGENIPQGYQDLTYTSFDLPHTIQTGESPTAPGSFSTDFGYDADQQRVLKRTTLPGGDSITTLYADDGYERIVDTTNPAEVMHKYRVFVGGTQIAQVTKVEISGEITPDQVELRYLHDDHLGSAQAISDEDGDRVGTQNFDPFGNTGTAQSEVLTGFTGHQHDTELGLINMRGRLYDPRVGQFTSPDPFVQAPYDSQGLNPYSYVFNSPLNFVDPSGFQGINCAAVDPLYFGPERFQCEAQTGWAQAQAASQLAQTRAQAEAAARESAEATALSSEEAGEAAQSAGERQQEALLRAIMEIQSRTARDLMLEKYKDELASVMERAHRPENNFTRDGGEMGGGPPKPPRFDPPLAARVLVPFVDNITTTQDPRASPDEKAWALVGIVVEAAIIGATAGFGMVFTSGSRAVTLGDDAVRGISDIGKAAEAALKAAKKLKININSKTGREIIGSLDTSLLDFVSKHRQGKILHELPKSLLTKETTVREALESGGPKVRKLLTDQRFAK